MPTSFDKNVQDNVPLIVDNRERKIQTRVPVPPSHLHASTHRCFLVVTFQQVNGLSNSDYYCTQQTPQTFISSRRIIQIGKKMKNKLLYNARENTSSTRCFLCISSFPHILLYKLSMHACVLYTIGADMLITAYALHLCN